MCLKTNVLTFKKLHLKLFRGTVLASLVLVCTRQVISKNKTKYWSLDWLRGDCMEDSESAASTIYHQSTSCEILMLNPPELQILV